MRCPRVLINCTLTPDLGGDVGAGGVGGLLAVTRHERGAQGEATFWACADLNGNVIGLISATTTKLAVYEYDPFGRLMRVNEPEEGLNPIRFSSKYADAETGMSYYGHRYLRTDLGRWLNKDPMEEQGGVNLYAFVSNNGVNGVDYLGQFDWSRLKSMGSFTLPFNNFIPQLPSVTVVANTYNHRGAEFDADLTLAFTWNATGAIGRYVPRSMSVIAEVGFSGSRTVHICGTELKGGSSKLTISVFVQGSLGSGSRTSGPIQPPSRNPAHNANYTTSSGTPLQGYTPPGSPPANGLFATLRGQSDWVFDMDGWTLDWKGITVYVDAGYRFGWASSGTTLGPYYLFQD